MEPGLEIKLFEAIEGKTIAEAEKILIEKVFLIKGNAVQLGSKVSCCLCWVLLCFLATVNTF